MLHTGSRNLGKQVAERYNKIAVELNSVYYSSVDKKVELAFLPIESKEHKLYLNEMEYCVGFAKMNRELIASRIKEVISLYVLNTEYSNELDIAHNYAKWEHWNNRNVIVHRKGAVHIPKDSLGIIPGSMGTASYIVKGKGNDKSLDSCSHGSGRRMGRKEAVRSLDLNEVVNDLNAKGIFHSIVEQGDLEEAPNAYKNIEEVMNNQEDLVEIVTKLVPVGSIKG